jgi:carbon-monoxide dehydrogenase small subunit
MTADYREMTLHVNGRERSIRVDPSRRLLDVLRRDLGLRGSKEGCGLGECGACTVLLDGEPVNSCLVLVGSVEGSRITTIEGLSGPGEPHPVQRAFVEAGAIQCGFCTPGFILNTVSFVEGRESATDEEIRKHLAGNLCRCTGYAKIIEAVQLALRWKREESSSTGPKATKEEGAV